MDGGTPVGVPTLRSVQAPTPAPDSGSDDAWAGAKLRQRHDQRHQPLAVVLDEAQEL